MLIILLSLALISTPINTSNTQQDKVAQTAFIFEDQRVFYNIPEQKCGRKKTRR